LQFVKINFMLLFGFQKKQGLKVYII